MLTSKQQEWIEHLSNTDKVSIKPFDLTANKKFEKLKIEIQSRLGKEIKIEHHGSTYLGISGQDEIDAYVPVLGKDFDDTVFILTNLFNDPKSLYSSERARFVTNVDEKHIDIFVINKENKGWTNMIMFEKYLLKHQDSLDEYKKLKEDGAGLSTREYYKRKIEFINLILAKI